MHHPFATNRRACLWLALASTGLSQPLLAQGVGDELTEATASDGRYIRWREHLVDDAAALDFVLSGGDGLVMTDIDNDGFVDIVSVHESDSMASPRYSRHSIALH
jgi:hypothetical protein